MRDAAFYEALPKKRLAAAALFVDAAATRVLLVEPTYKDNWELPGGLVEPDESPRAACVREVREELGIDVPIGRLLCIDYVPGAPPRVDGIMLVYAGGVVRDGEVAAYALPADELRSCELVAGDDLGGRLEERMARRVLAAMDALRTGALAELEDGYPVR